MSNFLHIDTKLKQKQSFIVYNSKIKKTETQLKICNNQAIVKDSFGNYISSSAIEIRDFIFESKNITLTFYFDNLNYFIDISEYVNFFNSFQMFNLRFDNYVIKDIEVNIQNNLIQLPLFSEILNTNVITCVIDITKKYSLHINEINKIHFLETIDNYSLKFRLYTNDFNVQTNFTILFIDKIIQPNTNLSNFSQDILFRNAFTQIKLTYISFPQINNISSNYRNNELIFDIYSNKYKIIIPNRYWHKNQLLSFIKNMFNTMDNNMNMEIQFDNYSSDYYKIYIYEKVEINKIKDKSIEFKDKNFKKIDISKLDSNEIVYMSIPFKIRKSNLSICMGFETFTIQHYYYNTYPIDLHIVLAIYARLNNVHGDDLLYLYDQENKNMINEISFLFTETVINNISLYMKINNYVADFNNLDYNIILKFS